MRRVVIATATTIISVGAVLGAAEAADFIQRARLPLQQRLHLRPRKHRPRWLRLRHR